MDKVVLKEATIAPWQRRLCAELKAVMLREPDRFWNAQKHSGLSRTRFDAVRKGQVEPTFSEVQAIVDCFGLSADYILTGLVPCRQ